MRILLNEIIIGLAIGAILFIVIAMIMLLKLKFFEKETAGNAISLVVVGLFFYLIMAIADVLNYLSIFDGIYDVSTYINLELINNVISFFVAPLIIICFIAAIFVMRENY